MSRPRKCYTPEENMAILKRCLVEKVPVSDLCDELGLNVNSLLRLAEAALRERRGRLPEGTQSPGGRVARPERSDGRGELPQRPYSMQSHVIRGQGIPNERNDAAEPIPGRVAKAASLARPRAQGARGLARVASNAKGG